MIKAGVIGLGQMGKNHARIYSEINDVELVGVADIDFNLAQAFAKKYHTTPFSDYRELLKQGLDAVSIVVPTSLHKQVALDAVSAGTHILLEKPISDTIEGAREIISKAEQNNIKLMLGHIERFNPAISVLKEHLIAKEISLIEITRIGPFPPRIMDVGVIIDMATHDIDLVGYLTGSNIQEVHSLYSKSISSHEDAAILLFKMENNSLARITVNWLTPFKVREINIATKEKYIKTSLIDQKIYEYSRNGEDGSYLVTEPLVPLGEPLAIEIKAFLNSITNNTLPPVTGEDGLRVLEIAIQCLNSKVK
ncbi:Gfo/Idh/MocA family oxidoreductase [Chloroflexota bacterium]